MLVLALQFSRAARDLLVESGSPGALAVIAGTAAAVAVTSSSALPSRVAPSKRNSDATPAPGSRWCLRRSPKRRAGVGMVRVPTHQ